MEGKISKNIVKNDDTISGYLAGAFLAGGSINSPETSNYHLEISVNSENYAKWLSHLFLRYKNNKIEPRIIKRRNKYILYFKKGENTTKHMSRYTFLLYFPKKEITVKTNEKLRKIFTYRVRKGK